MEAILRDAATTLRSATGLITESFDALHFVPVHGIGTGTDFEQAEAASPNLGQRFTRGIDEFTFQISLGHSNYLSVAASARGIAWERNEFRVMQGASRTKQQRRPSRRKGASGRRATLARRQELRSDG